MPAKIEALPQLQIKHEDDKISCLVCRRECNIGPEQTGYCGGYENRGGTLFDHTYGKVTTAQVTQIGWAPVTEFVPPETRMLSVGSRGCNFDCPHCFNGDHAWARHHLQFLQEQIVDPQILIEYAQALSCQGIAANFNEGLLAIAFWRDTFRLAKEEGLFTVAVTNGYNTRQALDLVMPYLDVFRVDIKAISPEAMLPQAKGIEPEGVLDSLLYVKTRYPETHIEVVTLLLPGVNDTVEELGNVARWIYENLGPTTPWHISPFKDPFEAGVAKAGFAPAYLTSGDLLSEGKVTALTIKFTDEGTTHLVVGDWGNAMSDQTIFDLSSRPELLQAVTIGEEAGLQRVLPKLDGH